MEALLFWLFVELVTFLGLFSACRFTHLFSLFFFFVRFNLFPPSSEFPVPKNELVQRFHVNYLGCVPVARPVGKERMGKDFFSYAHPTPPADGHTGLKAL